MILKQYNNNINNDINTKYNKYQYLNTLIFAEIIKK